MSTNNTELWQMANWLQPVPYIVGQYITEYDMSKANISVLYQAGVINKDLYNELYNSEKFYREKYIGMMERNNPKISEIKADYIAKYRKAFIESNEISDNEILAIKNDAIFVLGQRRNITHFDEVVNFRIANVYNLYMKIGIIELYYGVDSITGEEIFDVKGINDRKLELHRNGMAYILCDTFYTLLTSGAQEAINVCEQFLYGLLNRQLGIDFYREFNADSAYRFMSGFSCFEIPNISPDMVKYVDISTNVNFIRKLLGNLSDIYLTEINKAGR